MLLDFLVDYSRHPELREEFKQDPAKVFSRYEVSPTDQRHLEEHDREAIAARLHQDVDEMLSGAQPWMWQYPTPEILENPQPSSGPVQESHEIRILAKHLAKNISVEFFNPTGQVTATVKSVTPHLDGSSTIRCTATFPSKGKYSLTVSNLFPPHTYSATRPDCFTAT